MRAFAGRGSLAQSLLLSPRDDTDSLRGSSRRRRFDGDLEADPRESGASSSACRSSFERSTPPARAAFGAEPLSLAHFAAKLKSLSGSPRRDVARTFDKHASNNLRRRAGKAMRARVAPDADVYEQEV